MPFAGQNHFFVAKTTFCVLLSHKKLDYIEFTENYPSVNIHNTTFTFTHSNVRLLKIVQALNKPVTFFQGFHIFSCQKQEKAHQNGKTHSKN